VVAITIQNTKTKRNRSNRFDGVVGTWRSTLQHVILFIAENFLKSVGHFSINIIDRWGVVDAEPKRGKDSSSSNRHNHGDDARTVAVHSTKQ